VFGVVRSKCLLDELFLKYVYHVDYTLRRKGSI